jgi:hypothetical protein
MYSYRRGVSDFLTARSAAKLTGFVREPREELGEAHDDMGEAHGQADVAKLVDALV